ALRTWPSESSNICSNSFSNLEPANSAASSHAQTRCRAKWSCFQVSKSAFQLSRSALALNVHAASLLTSLEGSRLKIDNTCAKSEGFQSLANARTAVCRVEEVCELRRGKRESWISCSSNLMAASHTVLTTYCEGSSRRVRKRFRA